MMLAGCGRFGFEAPAADALAAADASTSEPVDSGDTPAAPAWTLVQTRSAIPQSRTPLDIAINIDPLGARHLVVVAVEVDQDGTVSSVTDDCDNTYELIPAAHTTCAAMKCRLDTFYVRSSCAGSGAIRITATTEILAAVMWEASGLRGDDPLDTASTVPDDRPATTAPVSPSIATNSDGEFVVAVAIAENKIQGLRAGSEFTNDQNSFFNGWAHLTDTAAKAGTHQAEWVQDQSGAYCANAAAFRTAPPPDL